MCADVGVEWMNKGMEKKKKERKELKGNKVSIVMNSHDFYSRVYARQHVRRHYLPRPFPVHKRFDQNASFIPRHGIYRNFSRMRQRSINHHRR